VITGCGMEPNCTVIRSKLTLFRLAFNISGLLVAAASYLKCWNYPLSLTGPRLSIDVTLKSVRFISPPTCRVAKADDAFVQRQSFLASIVTPAVPRFTDERVKLRSVNGIGFALSILLASSRLIQTRCSYRRTLLCSAGAIRPGRRS
jgi:hypothetical protein